MFFRIWVLYLSKLFFVGFVLCIGANFVGNATLHAWAIKVAWVIMAPIAFAGALAGVWFIVLQKPIACPRCYAPGKFGAITKYDVGVMCRSCGLVHVNGLLGFRLKVEPPEEETRREHDVE